jgi:hypothetical protein
VISLSLNRQQQTLYDPLQGSASSGWGSVRAVLTRVVSAAGWMKDAFLSPARLFTLRGAAILSLLVLAFIGLKFACRSWHRTVRLPLPFRPRGLVGRILDWVIERVTGRTPDARRVVVAFYERFQTLIAAAGFAPREDQTQREFARHVEQALAGRLVPAGLDRFPSELTEHFYHVRFGDGSLPASEVEGLEDRLERLRTSLFPASRGVLRARLAKPGQGN